MHPQEVVDEARRLYATGLTVREIERRLGLPYRTILHWCRGARRPAGAAPRASCFRCTGRAADETSYAYLLGSYLGDGHITHHRRRVAALSVFCGDDWPGIQQEVAMAMSAVMPSSKVCRVQRLGCTEIKSYSVHWPCLFPQHGPGMKHTRRIALEPWQELVVADHTGPFLRGLFHSDGCRVTNWTRRLVAGEPKRYEYPRYFFSNESADILDICAAALDRLGIAHRRPRRNTVSVARRDAVAALDTFAGPKY